MCTNENALGSLLYCGYQSTEANNTGINREISNGCVPYNVTNLTDSYYDVIYAKTLKTIVDISNSISFNKTEVIDYPVTSKKLKKLKKLSHDFYMSVRNRRGNIKSSHALGISFVGASVFVMLVSGVVN